MDFRSTHVFSVKKADNSANFAAGGIIKRTTRHNSLCGDKEQTLGDQLYDGYKAMSYVMLHRMREISSISTLVA
jgi:hypothetical protein